MNHLIIDRLPGIFSILKLFMFLSIVIIATSCEETMQEPVKFAGEVQGTYYAVTYFDDEQRNLLPEVDSILEDFDQTASAWVPNSIISRINRNDSNVAINEDFRVIFEVAMEINTRSGGAFDMTVGPLVRQWGFGPEGPVEPDTNAIDSLLQLVGHDKIWLDGEKVVKASPEVRIDFNAIAQGYSVDLLGEFLESKGITSYIVDIGGEVLAKGGKPGGIPWKVGIEQPTENADDERSLQSVVMLFDKSLATSGNYRKYYEKDGIRYSHTIDPSTGYPVSHSLLSVSVLAGNACIADAWATAFMVMGHEKAKEILTMDNSLEAYFIYTSEDGKMEVWYSEGFEELLENE